MRLQFNHLVPAIEGSSIHFKAPFTQVFKDAFRESRASRLTAWLASQWAINDRTFALFEPFKLARRLRTHYSIAFGCSFLQTHSTGAWKGHVKKAKKLCAKGWSVCSPSHMHLLKMLTWNDVTTLAGCYAYDASNSLQRCSP